MLESTAEELGVETAHESKIRVNIIVAGVPIRNSSLLGIGYQGRIPWYLSEDLRYFRQITLSHIVIMGRRTWESIPETHRPLAGRANIVISRNGDARNFSGARLVRDLDEALSCARTLIKYGARTEVFIIGGAELYRTYLTEHPKEWYRLYLTRIKQGSWLPAYDTYFNLDWVPSRIIKSINNAVEADYEIYERGV
jgi:dihydrofolate reductase